MSRVFPCAALVAVVWMAGGAGISPARASTDPTALNLANTSEYLIGGIAAALVVNQCCQKGAKPRTEAGLEMVAGLAVVSVATEGLKYVVRQKRPYPSEDVHGFPSGHTSLAFCFARILDSENSKVGIPAYAWAAAVGWARVRDRDHTTEQALAGAALGSWVGNATVHYFRHKYPGSCTWPRLADKVTERIVGLPTTGGPAAWGHEDPGMGVRAWQRDF